MKRDFKTKLDDAINILAVQADNGNWNYDPYMQGMFNGMEMIMSIFEEREPKFKSSPDMWLADKINTGRDLETITEPTATN